MQKKTIRKVLNNKISEWISSIDDESVRELVKSNTIVTGGSIASMLLKEPVNDYDVYFRNEETVLAVAEYYVKEFKKRNRSPNLFVSQKDDRIAFHHEDGHIESDELIELKSKNSEVDPEDTIVQTIESETDTESTEKYRPVFISENAVTLSDRIQLVVRFYGEPEEIHENYDFVHACNYYDYADDNLILKPKALEALLERKLYYVGSLYPICSIFRAKKFIKRDWSISAGELLKIMFQISKIDMTDIDELKSQLVGVDALYFTQLLNKLKNNPEKVNETYLFNLIDELWND
mgnify:CR=1 FL=1